MTRTYWYVTKNTIQDLIDDINFRATIKKIHVINVVFDGVQYIAIYEVDE